jgi:hypothetical protein
MFLEDYGGDCLCYDALIFLEAYGGDCLWYNILIDNISRRLCCDCFYYNILIDNISRRLWWWLSVLWYINR